MCLVKTFDILYSNYLAYHWQKCWTNLSLQTIQTYGGYQGLQV